MLYAEFQLWRKGLTYANPKADENKNGGRSYAIGHYTVPSVVLWLCVLRTTRDKIVTKVLEDQYPGLKAKGPIGRNNPDDAGAGG